MLTNRPQMGEVWQVDDGCLWFCQGRSVETVMVCQHIDPDARPLDVDDWRAVYGPATRVFDPTAGAL